MGTAEQLHTRTQGIVETINTDLHRFMLDKIPAWREGAHRVPLVAEELRSVDSLWKECPFSLGGVAPGR